MKRDSALHRKSPIEEWPIAPRLFEEAYSVLDAVVLGGLPHIPLKHADRIAIANLAQLVNVIAPISTSLEGELALYRPSCHSRRLRARTRNCPRCVGRMRVH